MDFPKTEKELEIYVLLQEIVRLSNIQPSPYMPENRIVETKLSIAKEKYFNLVNS